MGDHLKAMIIAETCFNLQWSSFVAACCNSMNTPIQDHLKTIIIAETSLNFK